MMHLQIRDIGRKSQKSEVELVCNEVMILFRKMISAEPPLGTKPVVLHQARDGWPRARYDGLFDQYNINLTCLKPYTSPAQTIYQFAHELGHFYTYPSEMETVKGFINETKMANLTSPWNNWFTESCCCALSYICLDKISKKWGYSRNPKLKKWSASFKEYRKNEIQKALDELKIHSDELDNWIKLELITLYKDCTTEDKPKHKVCAILIERELRKNPTWGALCHLGNATIDGKTDFDHWHEAVILEQRPLIRALGNWFALKDQAEG